MSYDRRILLTGATGFVGQPLVHQLHDSGYECFVLSRSPDRAARQFPDGVYSLSYDSPWPNVSAVLNLAGESVAGLWTPAKRRRILHSRLQTTRRLVNWLRATTPAPHTFISMSAIGFYGHRPGERLTESAGLDPENKFRARVTQAWETEAQAARDVGVRVVRIRLANVLHPSGGFLRSLLRAYRFFPLVSLGNPDAVFSWISRRDAVHLLRFALERNDLHGALNAAAPHPVTKRLLTDVLGVQLHRRPQGFVPDPVLRLVLGDFSAALLDDQAVYPREALAHGFSFQDPYLEPCLERHWRQSS